MPKDGRLPAIALRVALLTAALATMPIARPPCTQADALGRQARELQAVQEPRSDEQLRRDVENALRFDPATRSLEITVSVQDAVATLVGTVNTTLERVLAERVARRVKGLRDVRNALAIRYQQRPASRR